MELMDVGEVRRVRVSQRGGEEGAGAARHVRQGSEDGIFTKQNPGHRRFYFI